MRKNYFFVLLGVFFATQMYPIQSDNLQGKKIEDLILDESNAIINSEDIEDKLNAILTASASKTGYPLKGFYSFAVFPRYYSSTQDIMDETNQILIKELKKFGTVKNIQLHGTIPYEAFEGFASGAFLSLDVQDLDSIEDKKIPITQCSLTLITCVNIEKTKESCPACIWNKECFLEGISTHLFEEKMTQCVRFLLKEFMEEYSFFNPKQKPVFYFYGQ